MTLHELTATNFMADYKLQLISPLWQLKATG